VQVPFIVGLTLYLNRRTLPPTHRPGWLTTAMLLLAGGFYLVLAVVQLTQS